MVLSDHSFAQKYVLEMEMSSSFTMPYDPRIIDFSPISVVCAWCPSPDKLNVPYVFPTTPLQPWCLGICEGHGQLVRSTLWPGSTKLPSWVVKYWELNIEKLSYVFIIQASNLAVTFVVMPQGILYYEILVSCVVNILCVVNSVKIRFLFAFCSSETAGDN